MNIEYSTEVLILDSQVHFVGEEGIDTGGSVLYRRAREVYMKNVPALQVSVGITQMHFIIYAY